jgi:hypothetical protein
MDDLTPAVKAFQGALAPLQMIVIEDMQRGRGEALDTLNFRLANLLANIIFSQTATLTGGEANATQTVCQVLIRKIIRHCQLIGEAVRTGDYADGELTITRYENGAAKPFDFRDQLRRPEGGDA